MQFSDNWVQTIQTFLADPPAGTPAPLIAALGHVVRNEKNSLPIHVFCEAVKQAQLAISITDLKTQVLYVNLAFEHMTGCSIHEMIGKYDAMLSDENTSSKVWDCLRQQKPWSGTLFNQSKNGTHYITETNVVPLRNEKGETTHYLTTHHDVTQIYHLKEQLKHQKTLIESVVDLAPVVIVLLNDATQTVLANQEYQKLAKDIQEEPALFFLSVIKKQLGESRWYDIRHQGGHFGHQEVCLQIKGSSHWFVCSGTWFHETSSQSAEQKYYLLLIANEMTQLKRQQEEVRTNTLRALLAEEELNEGMRETLMGVIHQLQVPINLISAALNLLKRRTKEDSLCSVLQETLEKSNQALDNLKQGMPLPYGTEKAVMPVNFNELLSEVLTVSTQRLLAEGITVDWKPTLMLPSFLGHVAPLRSMFKNLVNNAIDAMKKNRHSPRELRIFTLGNPEVIKIIIEDTGVGIPEELHLKVFEPFYTSNKTGRIGTGLSAVQEVVNLHAGTIHVDPEYKMGCRFIIQFPSTRNK